MQDAMKRHGKWIQEAIKNPESLHKSLKVKAGEKIPAKKLEVKSTDTPLMKKRKTLAKTLKGFNK